MVYVPVQCQHCHSTEVIKAGKQAKGAQRYRCQNDRCERRIFLLQYQDRGRIPEIRRQVVDMAMNGSGVRDTARVLRISPTTVIAVLKKKPPCFKPSTPRCSTLLVHAPSAPWPDARLKLMR
jgi:insertion element IS1 protein InsB